MRSKLTKSVIDSTRPGLRRVLLWDSQVTGFDLKVERSGIKVFVLQYRMPGRPSRRYTIGRYGDLTVEEARKLAARLRGQLAEGQDPADQRQQLRAEATVRDLAERFMSEHAEVRKKPSGCLGDRRRWKGFVLPRLGRFRVSEVSRADIARLHHDLRRTPYQANRVLAMLSKAFNLAERWGWRPQGSNPVRGLDRFLEKRRERLLSKEELGRLQLALDQVAESGEETPWAVAAVRLLLHTGCRKGEILTLRWSEVDLENRVLRLADSKTGAKLVPLSQQATEILRTLPRVADNPFVIVGREPRSHLVGLHRIWARIRALAALPDLRVHDLRHHFASLGAASGLSLPILGALLGHKSPATTARYLHWQTGPLLAAADLISGRMERTGGEAQEVRPG